MIDRRHVAGFVGGFGATVAAGKDAVTNAAASALDLVPLAIDVLVVVA